MANAQLPHQFHILFKAVIMITCRVSCLHAPHMARHMGKLIPDGETLAALKSRAFDLVCGRCRTPDKIPAKSHENPPYASFTPFFQARMGVSACLPGKSANRPPFSCALPPQARERIFFCVLSSFFPACPYSFEKARSNGKSGRPF